MKLAHYTWLTLIIAFIPSAFADETFEHYRKLSELEREKVINEASPELQKQFERWNQIISKGGAWWSMNQAKSVITFKHLNALSGLSDWQMNLWGYFELATIEANKKSGMAKELQNSVTAALEAEIAPINKERYKDQIWYLVKLAPTAEALALNEKAAALELQWSERFDKQKVTREDLKVIDAAVKEIRDHMRTLPQWTPEEIETALGVTSKEEVHR